MKLFKKILSTMLSFAIFFTSNFSLCVFADDGKQISTVPTTLEECWIMLDKICSQEEKNEIKQSSTDQLCRFCFTPLGCRVRNTWLYSQEKNKPSQLATLLLEHGTGFETIINLGYDMVMVILYSYRYYLLNGISIINVEDWIIDFYFNRKRCSNPDFKRETLEKKIEIWKKTRESRKTSSAPSESLWQCNIL